MKRLFYKEIEKASENDLQYAIRSDLNLNGSRVVVALLMFVSGLLSSCLEDGPGMTWALLLAGLFLYLHSLSVVRFEEYLAREGKLTTIQEANEPKNLLRTQIIGITTFVVCFAAFYLLWK